MLTFWHGKLAVVDTARSGVARVVTSIERFNALVSANGGNIMCSSSVDFPEDYTNDAGVIALCREIRS